MVVVSFLSVTRTLYIKGGRRLNNFPNISDEHVPHPSHNITELRRRLLELLALPSTCDSLLIDLIEVTLKRYKEKR